MQSLFDFPYIEMEFDRVGAPNPAGQDVAISAAIGEAKLTDLIIISHGWNNDMADARALYADMFKHVRAVFPKAAIGGDRRLGVLGILWPSKKFTDRELIPGGGAASLGGGAGSSGPDAAGDLSTAYIERQIDILKEVSKPSGPDLEKAKTLVELLETSEASRKEFVRLVRESLDSPAPAQITGEPGPEASASALDHDAEDIFALLRIPLLDRPAQSDFGGAASMDDASATGGAVGIGSMFSSAKAAAERLLNFATYYQMKERAGRVGGSGGADLLRGIRKNFPDLRIHLVGHSFGARLVTAIADTCGQEVRPASMLLLQAAFSHNGFAPTFKVDQNDYTGFFRRVVQDHKIAGPIVITHTVNDKAVGIAYALASRLAKQAAEGLGDENDIFGGLGRNGAIRMPESELGGKSLELLDVGGSYAFAEGRVFNLKADRFIAGHSEISNDAVAYALLKTIA